MRPVFALSLLLALVAGAVAHAASGEGAPGTNVDMPFLIAPLNVDGKLYGYAYISSKVVTSTQGAALEVRDKIPFIQDAFVRDVNAAPIGKATDSKSVDEPALIARLLADAKRVVGAAKIKNVVLTQIQISAIHPDQALAANPAN